MPAEALAESPPRAKLPPEDRLWLRLDSIAELLDCSPRQVQRMVAAGDLPEPDVRRGRKFVRWSRDLILPAIERLAAGEGEAAAV